MMVLSRKLAGAVAMSLALGLMTVSLATPLAATKEAKKPAKHPAVSSLKFRLIGPSYPSGRISDFSVHPDSKADWLVSTASAGLWRTEDAGTTWKPLFDSQPVYALGVVERDPSDPDIIWVGSGENNSQRSVAGGNGVYKSLDGGKSWQHVGLKNSGHISQIWVHPADGNVVLVAAQGPLWSNGGDRGLYKTIDGGKTWARILEIDAYTGVNEFVVHADNPDRIVASSYQRRRHVWTLINGGPGSTVHVSEDGGKTWKKGPAGFAAGEDLGRIGLASAPSEPGRVYAIVEAEGSAKGVYMSRNFGRTWAKRSSHITTSPQYYNELVVDPNNADMLYSLDTYTTRSMDAGKTFKRIGNKGRHVDDHALWIDPDNSKHLVIGGDGGVYESWNGGSVWRHADNLPIVQFYRVQPDNREPFYNVCGGTQDNNSLCGPSRTTMGHGIVNTDWRIILGGDGYEPQSDPTDPNIIYTQYQYGGLARYDWRTQERTWIAPIAGEGETAYKFNWNTPLLISPHNPKRIYYAAEYLFVSDDRGDSWRKISGDLTRKLDRNALPVMDRVWSDNAVAKNDSTSIYGAAIGVSESYIKPGLIYVGTDDGLIHITSDMGENWATVSKFDKVPDMSLVEDILASRHDVNVAYAVVDNHKRGDNKPYVLKTTDQGKKWRLISGDLPATGSVHTIVEDHVDPNLLFVGTEYGVFVTTNGGKNWHQMKSGLPTIAVRDLEIQTRENDLIVGTFGRGIYVVDDYSALRTPVADLKKAEASIMPVKDALMYVQGDLWGGEVQQMWRAENPPFGAVFTYYLRDGYKTMAAKRKAADAKKAKDGKDTPYPAWDDLRTEDREEKPSVIFTIRDAAGNVIRRLTGKTGKGLHRLAWNLRYPAPGRTGSRINDSSTGPFVLPGTYSVSMAKRVGGELVELAGPISFTVKPLLQSPENPDADTRKATLAFAQKAARLHTAVDGAAAKHADMVKHLAYVERALYATGAASEAQQQQVRKLRADLADYAVVLNGDSTISRRNEPVPVSLRFRTSRLTGWIYGNQSAVGGAMRDNYATAAKIFADLLPQMKATADALSALEASLDDIGAGYTPGRLPVWQPE